MALKIYQHGDWGRHAERGRSEGTKMIEKDVGETYSSDKRKKTEEVKHRHLDLEFLLKTLSSRVRNLKQALLQTENQRVATKVTSFKLGGNFFPTNFRASFFMTLNEDLVMAQSGFQRP